jgi:hemerythrin
MLSGFVRGCTREQHQVLIDIINRIWHQLVAPGGADASVAGLLEDLQLYTETHFTAEEHLMRDFGYPGLERHQARHREFVEQIRLARDGHLAGKPIAMELLRFLNDWLIHHIKVVDRDYATFIAGKQTSGVIGRFSALFPCPAEGRWAGRAAGGSVRGAGHASGHPRPHGLAESLGPPY